MDKPINSFGNDEASEPDQWSSDSEENPFGSELILGEVLETCPELAGILEDYRQEGGYE